MGRLVIAHHKSYHPYRRDNIEKVRRDEEEARQKEAHEEGRMMLADSEARMDLLRERAGVQQSGKHGAFSALAARTSSGQLSAPATNRHINLFEDLEQNAVTLAARASKKPDAVDNERGFALAPSTKDLRPWYSEKSRLSDQQDEIEDDRRKRDALRKSMNDPLASVNHQLASRASTSGSSNRSWRPAARPHTATSGSSEVDARLSRESSERQRALELIRRKKREQDGSETPSTIHGARGGYGDVFNRREVEEAHRVRDRRWDGRDHAARADSRGSRQDQGGHRRRS